MSSRFGWNSVLQALFNTAVPNLVAARLNDELASAYGGRRPASFADSSVGVHHIFAGLAFQILSKLDSKFQNVEV